MSTMAWIDIDFDVNYGMNWYNVDVNYGMNWY